MPVILTDEQIRGIFEQINGGELNHGQVIELTVMLLEHRNAESWPPD
jgi:hypothetical protein